MKIKNIVLKESLFAKYSLPVVMGRILLTITTIVLLSTIFVTCTKDPSSSTNDIGKYDAAYDFSMVVTQPPVGNQTVFFPVGFFIIKNGIISSSNNTLSGTVLDNLGNVKFTGPCPNNNGLADFTGVLDASGNPKVGGGGDYICQIGGIKRSWLAFNGK